jgi:DNA-binding response OmpR family regulator
VIAAAEAHPADSVVGSILIVDDDRSVADTFARMLQLEGFTVATALDPTVGLELAESIRPQAIILDMRMPMISGIQFLRQLRANPHLADVPVAIVTGDYFLSEALQTELTALHASLRFKPLWLEELVTLAKTLIPR